MTSCVVVRVKAGAMDHGRIASLAAVSGIHAAQTGRGGPSALKFVSGANLLAAVRIV
ncbi:MAG: hypothetical protein IPH82_27735 [Chloroflexi bacterium]|nr:hypothetical protein [Chloroflexota bacterium]